MAINGELMSDIANTNWDDIKHTDAKASCKSLRSVVDVMVITVTSANIRGATVSGTFEVADSPNPFRTESGELRVEVKCLWHDRKPFESWMHLAISNKYAFIRRYSGEVVANIA
jgi:hypothetical protein